MSPANSKNRLEPEASDQISVGKLLKRHRTERKLTLREVELATKIRGRYLRLLEADDTSELANDVYVRGFLRSYAEFLDLNGPVVVRKFEAQRGKIASVPVSRRTSLIKPRKLVYTPGLLIGVLAATALVAVVGYLAAQFNTLASAPRLEITNPKADTVVYGSVLAVTGHVDGGADVFVNESPILTDSNGNFSDSIALQDGLNTINVSAKSKLGKASTVSRNILAHIVKTDPANTLPVAVFDGVAASVAVKDRATTITAMADGKQIFKGIMLPGTTQVFKAATTLVLATGDAGATTVTITNTLVVGKTLGTLGQRGQTRTDLEFAKDTNFQ